MRALSAALALLNLLLGLGVFALVARPEMFLALVASLLGERDALLSGRMGEEGRQRLVRVAERLAVPALILLFCWSFLTGALLLYGRL